MTITSNPHLSTQTAWPSSVDTISRQYIVNSIGIDKVASMSPANLGLRRHGVGAKEFDYWNDQEYAVQIAGIIKCIEATMTGEHINLIYDLLVTLEDHGIEGLVLKVEFWC